MEARVGIEPTHKGFENVIQSLSFLASLDMASEALMNRFCTPGRLLPRRQRPERLRKNASTGTGSHWPPRQHPSFDEVVEGAIPPVLVPTFVRHTFDYDLDGDH